MSLTISAFKEISDGGCNAASSVENRCRLSLSSTCSLSRSSRGAALRLSLPRTSLNDAISSVLSPAKAPNRAPSEVESTVQGMQAALLPAAEIPTFYPSSGASLVGGVARHTPRKDHRSSSYSPTTIREEAEAEKKGKKEGAAPFLHSLPTMHPSAAPTDTFSEATQRKWKIAKEEEEENDTHGAFEDHQGRRKEEGKHHMDGILLPTAKGLPTVPEGEEEDFMFPSLSDSPTARTFHETRRKSTGNIGGWWRGGATALQEVEVGSGGIGNDEKSLCSAKSDAFTLHYRGEGGGGDGMGLPGRMTIKTVTDRYAEAKMRVSCRRLSSPLSHQSFGSVTISPYTTTTISASHTREGSGKGAEESAMRNSSPAWTRACFAFEEEEEEAHRVGGTDECGSGAKEAAAGSSLRRAMERERRCHAPFSSNFSCGSSSSFSFPQLPNASISFSLPLSVDRLMGRGRSGTAAGQGGWTSRSHQLCSPPLSLATTQDHYLRYNPLNSGRNPSASSELRSCSYSGVMQSIVEEDVVCGEEEAVVRQEGSSSMEGLHEVVGKEEKGISSEGHLVSDVLPPPPPLPSTLPSLPPVFSPALQKQRHLALPADVSTATPEADTEKDDNKEEEKKNHTKTNPTLKEPHSSRLHDSGDALLLRRGGGAPVAASPFLCTASPFGEGEFPPPSADRHAKEGESARFPSTADGWDSARCTPCPTASTPTASPSSFCTAPLPLSPSDWPPSSMGAAAAAPPPIPPPTSTRAPQTSTSDASASSSSTNGRNVYVASLPMVYDYAQFEKLFSRWTIEQGRLVMNGNKCKGYGFLMFHSEEDAAEAVRVVHGKMVQGTRIQVRLAREGATEKVSQVPSTSPGGAGGAVGGGAAVYPAARLESPVPPSCLTGPTSSRWGTASGEAAGGEPASGSGGAGLRSERPSYASEAMATPFFQEIPTPLRSHHPPSHLSPPLQQPPAPPLPPSCSLVYHGPIPSAAPLPSTLLPTPLVPYSASPALSTASPSFLSPAPSFFASSAFPVKPYPPAALPSPFGPLAGAAPKGAGGPGESEGKGGGLADGNAFSTFRPVMSVPMAVPYSASLHPSSSSSPLPLYNFTPVGGGRNEAMAIASASPSSAASFLANGSVASHVSPILQNPFCNAAAPPPPLAHSYAPSTVVYVPSGTTFSPSFHSASPPTSGGPGFR